MFYIASKQNNKRKAGIFPASFFLAIILLSLFFASCSSEEETDKGKLLASVYDKQLFEGELAAAMPSGLNEEDSIQFVKSFIKTWIADNILLTKAEENLGSIKQSMEYRIENYRRALMIYEYEQMYLRDNLDTSIQLSEITKYYNDNKGDFELKDYIIKCMYVKLEKGDTGKDKVIAWMKSDKKEDWLKLDEYCGKNAVSFYQDRDSWIFLNDILRDVPLETPNKESFLRNNKLVNFEDEEFAYILIILDYRMKEDTSPMSLEKENIKQRILQTRMNELIKEMRNKTVKSAYDNNEVELHYEK